MADRSEIIRLLAVGAALPTLLAVSDQWLLSAAGDSKLLWISFFIWLVAQTALMSFAAGIWLQNWPWRLIVLTWTLLQLNVMLFHAGVWGLGVAA